MCILCVIQKWSRRIATMLPWLVIPLIGLWALSQLLPPAFRFEITSPRLACVFVLLVTLFWYEILMPKLSAWRVRRNARLRERKRFEAIELQKLKKTATRRCRNCLTPYREQNPAGGKFMCSYCGHISKRPVLDLSIPHGLGVPNPGILKDLGVKNGKVWVDNGGLMCGQDWLDNGYWVGGSFPQKASYWRKHGGVFFGRDDHCLAEKSYSHVLIFAGRALTATMLSIMWVWRKIFRVGSSGGDASLDAERKRMGKRGENGANFQEDRGEKARKKAEEKRQAKLVKEQSEEEDRKQREEVLRLVDERRRSRDERMDVDKDRGKGPTPAKDNDNKKEAEKKRQLKKKERDRGSSKSNSDVEELEKRADKESERNGKSESGRRDHHRHGIETAKSYNNSTIKGAPTNNSSHGAAGTKYFDRVKGNIMSSSRAFTGHVKGAMNSVAVGREHRYNGPVNHYQTPVTKREMSQPDRVSGKPYFTGDDKNTNLPVHVKAQPCEAPKKTWRQLFTRSSTVCPSDSAVTDRPNGKSLEVTSPSLTGRPVTTQPYDNPINFGLPSPFPIITNPCEPMSSKGIQMSSESKFPLNGEALPECLLEDPDIFEDPCYVPDPVSLLGPVSESLDNFQLNLGFATEMGSEKPCTIQSIPISSEVVRPSPIEAPASRSRVQDERHASSFLLQGTPKAKDVHSTLANGVSSGNENGTWQMWNTSPLGPDGLGLSGGPASWLLSPDLNRPNKEEIATPLHQKNMASLFMRDEHIPSGTVSPQKVSFGSYQNGETYGIPMSGGSNDPWLPNALFGPLDSQDHFAIKPSERIGQDELTSGSPKSAANHPFELSSADRWPKVDWTVHGTGESTSNSPIRRPPVGVVYSSLDVQSIW
ncbi:hypothetical protein DCAR_0624855 [Daucus carota subsp. sativus]|uniref:Uncharacterized protein n=1 Tax=Daucus carota subsp. sativus TaxID=79200 RepID=A0AAF0XEQ5_DAUCS|nr:hypothetical protein DCAR_0624855 [Daucus carota subsp. sativus]